MDMIDLIAPPIGASMTIAMNGYCDMKVNVISQAVLIIEERAA